MSDILVSVGPIKADKAGSKFSSAVQKEIIKTAEKVLRKSDGFTPVPLPPPNKKGTAEYRIQGYVSSFWSRTPKHVTNSLPPESIMMKTTTID